jgi:mannitol/fructose-specific phosphotransferase system IIA component (Ntr-type)
MPVTISIGPSVLDIALCIPDLRPRRKDAVLQELALGAERAGGVRDPALLHETLCLRERLGSTAIGKGVAVPNARSIAVLDPRLVVARSRRGIDWKAADALPVRLVFLVLMPADAPLDAHHDWLARVVAFARLQRHRQRLIEAPSLESMSAVLRDLSS